MGKTTGFLEFERNEPEDRAPLERIKDWKEFHNYLPEKEQELQGARCMDCGVPFCHSGVNIAGPSAGCPLNNLIPEWNDNIFRGLWQEALGRLLKTNNFPEFTGRVCPAPCEGSCVMALHGPAISIKNNECSIVDRGFREGWIKPRIPEIRTEKKVAVIGSGPSGLAAADQLNQAGHSVTVYERADRAGGLLMYGIPNMKLDKSIVQRRIELMTAEGIRFITSCEVGKDIRTQQIIDENDAVILCTGATVPRDLTVEGRSLKGVHFAMEFLHANTKSLLDSGLSDGNYINAEGKDVIVIGGGDTGTDCVATSIRHKCRSVTQFEIMPKPPLTRASDNPWPQWPKVLKTDYGQEEAASLYGSDPRVFSVMTKKITGDSEGNVKEVHTVQVEWVTENGSYFPKEVPGTDKVWPAQLVLISMGFLGPDQKLIDELGLEKDNRSNIKAEYGLFKTSQPKVFAAGDARRGQSLVVWAIQEGRLAAKACHRHLMPEPSLRTRQ